MADRALFIGFGAPVRGREERAVEVFNESVGLYGRLQQAGRIEKFDIVLLEPNGSGMQGYFALHGTAQQLNDVREDEEFRRTLLDASLIVDGMRIIAGSTNEGVAKEMANYTEAIAKVPQRA